MMAVISRTTAILLLLLASNPAPAIGEGESSESKKEGARCERLKTSLTYTQEKAPRDISAVLRLVVEKVNRDVEGVVDVEVEWSGGELHRRVGDRIISCSVTRLLSSVKSERAVPDEDVGTDEHGRDVITQCFQVPFTILDTDECALPPGHVMQHQCHEPAACVNTIGSYECVCPLKGGTSVPAKVDDVFWSDLSAQARSPWEVSLNSTAASSCPQSPSTHGCCDDTAHTPEGMACRAAFRCPVDPCDGHHDCVPNAQCHRAPSPLYRPNYECLCPSGLMGNGHTCRKGVDAKAQPKVKYDGVTPTEETVRNNYYCGCTKPVVDACAGFPKCEGKHEACTVTAANTPVCACTPGYVRDDRYGCVDETPPILKLRHDPNGDGVNYLKQGDRYEEFAVDIVDDNAENYMRNLKIAYSHPLPPGCLSKMGEFHVNYTVATPWTSPPYVRITRTVIIENVNECELDVEKYETSCPELVPMCDTDAGAVCRDTVGSYTCQCPKFTTGDGFKTIDTIRPDTSGKFANAPKGYSGGTGCRDTSKPTIEVLGPNPKVFRICKCGGLSGIMGTGGQTDREKMGVEELRGDQRKRYEADIKEMIKATSGAELCATHTKPNPRAIDCVRATDHTYKGLVDLSARVSVGEPVQKNAMEWKVPYNVIDDAGNSARTVWRDIIVEEVDLGDVERRIRDEVLVDREREINDAVRKAVEKERRKHKGAVAAPTDDGSTAFACPECQKCVCLEEEHGISREECDKLCNQRIAAEGAKSCPAPVPKQRTISNENVAHPIILDILQFAEKMAGPYILVIVLLCSVGAAFLFILQRIMNAIFNPRVDTYYYTREDEAREKAMMDAVTYYRSPDPAESRNRAPDSAATVPPRTSMSLSGGAVGNGMFSPEQNRVFGGQQSSFTSPLFSPGGGSVGSRSRQEEDQSIYQTMSPITPSRSNGTPAPSTTPYNLRKRY